MEEVERSQWERHTRGPSGVGPGHRHREYPGKGFLRGKAHGLCKELGRRVRQVCGVKVVGSESERDPGQEKGASRRCWKAGAGAGGDQGGLPVIPQGLVPSWPCGSHRMPASVRAVPGFCVSLFTYLRQGDGASEP